MIFNKSYKFNVRVLYNANMRLIPESILSSTLNAVKFMSFRGAATIRTASPPLNAQFHVSHPLEDLSNKPRSDKP